MRREEAKLNTEHLPLNRPEECGNLRMAARAADGAFAFTVADRDPKPSPSPSPRRTARPRSGHSHRVRFILDPKGNKRANFPRAGDGTVNAMVWTIGELRALAPKIKLRGAKSMRLPIPRRTQSAAFPRNQMCSALRSGETPTGSACIQ